MPFANKVFRSRFQNSSGLALITALAVLFFSGCASAPRPAVANTGPRRGDEIIVNGQAFPTGTRVVTWLDNGGFNGYRIAESFGARSSASDPAALRRTVDQFVLHYDTIGMSRTCFEVLQKRKLSVHFLLDTDGTIYQTIDLKERAFHATIANDRSIGIEIANIGAFAPKDLDPLKRTYVRERDGRTRINFPPGLKTPPTLTPNFVGYPARNDAVRGLVQGQELLQYDFTPQQYAALAKLTATLCRVFPRIKCDYPHDRHGDVIPNKLSDRQYAKFHGVLGHYHIQENKIDPGPALQWQRLIGEARGLLK